MLYEPNYGYAPITYYPDPYPVYYYPTAPFFAAAITGVVWASVIDWNRHGIWGGPWRGGRNVYINCRNCFQGRNFNGRVRWSDVDWRKVDRRRISFDRNQIQRVNRRQFRNGLVTDGNNRLNRQATTQRKARRAQGYKSGTQSGTGQQYLGGSATKQQRQKLKTRNDNGTGTNAKKQQREKQKARKKGTDADATTQQRKKLEQRNKKKRQDQKSKNRKQQPAAQANDRAKQRVRANQKQRQERQINNKKRQENNKTRQLNQKRQRQSR
jgi:hypothetical protein